MSADPIAPRLELALSLADAAGEVALRGFRSPSLAVERKDDGSPVTAVDRAIERLLRERIAAAFPADAILGEEEAAAEGTSGFTWILDPIDGTEAFVRGVPLFGTLLACERDGEVELGVVSCPAAGEIAWGRRRRGAFWRAGGAPAVRARVSDTPALARALVSMTEPHGLARHVSPAALVRLLGAAGRTRGWSDCYPYVLLATGRVDAALDTSMAVWDNAPLLVLIEEAGGRFTDLAGERTIRGGNALASNGRIHDELLAALAD